MATGDVPDGDLLIKREDASDNQVKVVGRVDVGRLNTFEESSDNVLYLNAALANMVNPPATAESETAPNAVFKAGETIVVEFQPASDPANNIDVSGDQSNFKLRYIEKDLNRGVANLETFTLSDNEITTDVNSDPSAPKAVFRDTVGDRREVLLAGRYQAEFAEA